MTQSRPIKLLEHHSAQDIYHQSLKIGYQIATNHEPGDNQINFKHVIGHTLQ